MNTQGTIFIPDISGYTRFLTRTELQHSTHIINELLEIIMEANGEEFNLVEIEGDALLLFREGEPLNHKTLDKHCRKIFKKFHEHLKVIERDRICHCGACAGATNLSLKFVAHFGNVNTIKLGPIMKPTGVELIVAHRLLKNKIDSESYMIFTEKLVEECKTEDCLDPWQSDEEEYVELGKVSFDYLLLDDVKAGIPDAPRAEVPEFVKQGEFPSVDINVPFSLACDILLDNNSKMYWVQGIKEVKMDDDPVDKVGRAHICVMEGVTAEITNEAAVHHQNETRIVQTAKVVEAGMEMYNILEISQTSPQETHISLGIASKTSDPLPNEFFGMMKGIYQASLDQLKQYAEKKGASAQVVN
jgi:hypothetical protein